MKHKKLLMVGVAALLALSLVGSLGCPPPEEVYKPADGIVRLGSVYFTDSVNPFVSWASGYIDIMRWIYDYLYEYDVNDNLVPNLATNYTVDENVWTVTIRDDAVFPGGKALNATVVAWSYEYCWYEYYRFYSAVDPFESVEATGDWEVTITLQEEMAEDWVLHNILAALPIFPKHLWEAYSSEWVWDDGWLEPECYGVTDLAVIGVGSGPFQMTEFETDEYFLLEPKDWVDTDIEGVMVKVYAEAAVMYLDLRAGTIDGVRFLDKKLIADLEADPKIDVHHTAEATWLDEIIICSYPDSYDGRTKWPHPALEDKAVRHALEYSLDKVSAAEVAWGDWGTPAYQWLPPYYGDYSHTGLDIRSFNLDTANAILDAAGYTDWVPDDYWGVDIRQHPDQTVPLKFDIHIPMYLSEAIDVAEMWSYDAIEVGIRLDVIPIDSGYLWDVMMVENEYSFDISMWNWGLAPDPDSILVVLTSWEQFSWSDSGFGNTTYDDLYYEQTVALTTEARKDILWDMQEVLYEELPYIPYAWYPESDALRNDRVDVAGGLLTSAIGIMHKEFGLNVVKIGWPL